MQKINSVGELEELQSSFNSSCSHGVSSGHNDERNYDHELYDSFKPVTWKLSCSWFSTLSNIALRRECQACWPWGNFLDYNDRLHNDLSLLGLWKGYSKTWYTMKVYEMWGNKKTKRKGSGVIECYFKLLVEVGIWLLNEEAQKILQLILCVNTEWIHGGKRVALHCNFRISLDCNKILDCSNITSFSSVM